MIGPELEPLAEPEPYHVGIGSKSNNFKLNRICNPHYREIISRHFSIFHCVIIRKA
jgi:hypothetical protein